MHFGWEIKNIRKLLYVILLTKKNNTSKINLSQKPIRKCTVVKKKHKENKNAIFFLKLTCQINTYYESLS